MARILAIEPDPSLADALGRIIRDRVGAEAVLADSKEAAIAAIAAHVPDLILVSALLSPRDESDLADHLRLLDEIEHVQILTIPLLAVPGHIEPARAGGGLLSAFRRKRTKAAPSGCDPDRYGDELKGYLKFSVEARAEREAQRVRDERTKQRAEALQTPGVLAAATTDDDLHKTAVEAVATAEAAISEGAHDAIAEDAVAFDLAADEEAGITEVEAALSEPEMPATDEGPFAELLLAATPASVHDFDADAQAAPDADAAQHDETAIPDLVVVTPEAVEMAAADVGGDLDLDLSAEPIEVNEPAPTDRAERDDKPAMAAAGAPTPVPRPELYGLAGMLPSFVERAEEPPAAMDEDRIALSISSFEVDRRESDDYLLQAARDPAPVTHRVVPERADNLARAQSASVADLDPGSDTSDPALPLVEIWQALPDWVDSWPPLEAYIESDTTSKSGAHRITASETLAAAGPQQPPLDARSIATALDALRSEFQMFRAQAHEPRAAGEAVPPVETPTVAPQPLSPAPEPPAPTLTVAAPAPIAATPSDTAAAANAAGHPTAEPPRRKKKARKPKPIEDEWGMYDPSQAGIQALIAALDAKAEEEEEEETVEDLAELLLKHEPAATPVQVVPVGAIVASRPRLAPLSMWAHVDNGSSDSRDVELREQDYLRELLEGLDVPPHIAAVSYPTGCRIRRVRMAKDPNARATRPKEDEPVVILSRRALGRTKPETDKPASPTLLRRDP